MYLSDFGAAGNPPKAIEDAAGTPTQDPIVFAERDDRTPTATYGGAMSTERHARESTDGLFSHLESWRGEGVVVRHDRPTGAWIFVALHDATLGPPTGGTRMKRYPNLAEAALDAMRLAEGMTHKWAGLGLPYGGGKAVIALPGTLDGPARRGLLERYGGLLTTLGGAFRTGEDLGTTPEDMARIGSRTPWVLGFDADTGVSADPGPYTARGVFEGLRAAVGHVHGDASLDGRSVLVQGVGDVGGPLAQMLRDAGAEVLVCDLDETRAAELARSLDATVVAPSALYETPCDVFAPCAIGAVLSATSVPRLRCRIVAGSANNQLAESADAARLHERGIVYVPDYILNAGGALAFALMHDGEHDEDRLVRRVSGIGDVVTDLLRQSDTEGIPPLDAAHRQVERRLSSSREK